MPITTQVQLDLAKKVHEHVTTHPGQHYQGNWWVERSCGTTGCLAGWTTHFIGAEPVLADDRGGMRVASEVRMPGGEIEDIAVAAAEALGLDEWEACGLFYRTDHAAAIGRLGELIAEGELAVNGGTRSPARLSGRITGTADDPTLASGGAES